ncbi:hypothetical protein H6G33_09360 [Calothrix sp. FACHB-1219]|uniref:hypothetical protein n=1 Tax=unclassified Calothrix TaxID=2619626 RepID=UPI001688FAF5|nr:MULTISPECIES: hypothetical protein [unclassified Calothrix]MBD2201553.1 hypothetical protein [Calothrix sp. FACHB-168]MBD2217239.1 hypothetical protein [Calothrix sp. FACHB-1219]
MLYKSVVPSLSQLSYSIFKFLSNHPLLIAPLVLHPISKEVIPISNFRFMSGIPLNEGLTCSIFPGFAQVTEDGNFPLPSAVNPSVLYKAYNMGRNIEEAMYHFIVSYSYREVSIDGLDISDDRDLITIPKEVVMSPLDYYSTSPQTTQVELSINPPFDIISDYLELTRLALYDISHHKKFPLNPEFPGQLEGLDIIHTNYSSFKWSTGANSYFHMGHILFRINAYIDMGWRDRFIPLIEEINTSIELVDGEDIKA